MKPLAKQRHFAVIGAWLSGAACARALVEAGHRVAVFDKARGPGGRLATRRAEWLDATGQPQLSCFDHGTPCFDARSAAMRGFVESAERAGWLARWQPRIVGARAQTPGPQYVAVPNMPSLCQRLLEAPQLVRHWAHTITALKRPEPDESAGWQLSCAGERLETVFDAVILAMPPAQAAVLLRQWRSDWAMLAALSPMQACWTLMAVSQEPQHTHARDLWDIALPDDGPLGRVLRHLTRPGRARPPAGQAHWVAHARTGWSQEHLEQPPDWVQARLQEALTELVEQPLHWQYSTVHRWRYAVSQPDPSQDLPACWWDARLGLGVCGDFLGGYGVEGAWLSGQSLAATVLEAV